MVSKILILGMVAGLGIILYAITMSGDTSQNDVQLQDALDTCTNNIGNMQSSGSLEKCLDDAYEIFGTEEEKQIWFDDEH